jgi:hypothetical protein
VTLLPKNPTLPDNTQDWLDDFCAMYVKGGEFESAKAAIQQRFTAQAKQHQIELLEARIDALDQLLKEWKIVKLDTRYDIGKTAGHVHERNEQLKAELAKLVGEA